MAEPVRYHGFIASSDRWDGFALRDDDIVISTPSKCGTTWMQTLVALLLFDGVPPEPVYDLSPWLDMNLRSTNEVYELLEAQTHRRFIKNDLQAPLRVGDAYIHAEPWPACDEPPMTVPTGAREGADD